MSIRPILTEADYQKTLARIEAIFDARPGTPEGDELEVLGLLVEAWEQKHFPIEKPGPVEAIAFRMEQLGMQQSDLAKLLGSRSRASEILNGKRPLSLRYIRVLHKKLGIPAEILIQEMEAVG
ncbi:HTH-type transcriptional regulator / antitoxin HigA [Cyclonatronum proteinivorum]|uniref:HTH-type transcriptional regulator / antitoxin HigA n=1 Tax=Cyclonatronum proteinivorum TaxID=1457365 RepID=A0A345UP60_9BACT|nr:helix-turn-helix domain-containing protein [Cyclonatronum proteinivorum]AXJ02262.1 HTH-type transcriptional regulator / antitoxin HigA [Cyclonatronum proteinivorum]